MATDNLQPSEQAIGLHSPHLGVPGTIVDDEGREPRHRELLRFGDFVAAPRSDFSSLVLYVKSLLTTD